MNKVEVVVDGARSASLIIGNSRIELPFACGFEVVAKPEHPTILKFEMYVDSVTITEKEK